MYILLKMHLCRYSCTVDFYYNKPLWMKRSSLVWWVYVVMEFHISDLFLKTPTSGVWLAFGGHAGGFLDVSGLVFLLHTLTDFRYTYSRCAQRWTVSCITRQHYKASYLQLTWKLKSCCLIKKQTQFVYCFKHLYAIIFWNASNYVYLITFVYLLHIHF